MEFKRIRWLFIVFIVSLISFVLYYRSVFSTNYYPTLHRTQELFLQQEQQADSILHIVSQQIERDNAPKNSTLFSPFIVHIYRSDSLIFWNSNIKPMPPLISSYRLVDGMTKNQNGWYYTKTWEQNNHAVFVSFLVKQEYAYQNEYLKNHFIFPPIKSLRAQLIFDEDVGFPIYSKNNHYLFSIFVHIHQPTSRIDSVVLTILFFIPIFLFLWQCMLFIVRLSSNYTWTFPILLLLVRYISLKFSWFSFLQPNELFQPNLYGTSFLFPNLFEYLFNITLLSLIAHFVRVRLRMIYARYWKTTIFIFMCALFAMWDGLLYLFQGLIENSSIPLQTETLIHTNIYSIIAIFSIATLGFIYFSFGKSFIQFSKQHDWTLQQMMLINCSLFVMYIIVEYLLFDRFSIMLLFPGMFITLLIIWEYRNFQQKHLIIGMCLIALYAWICVVIIHEFTTKKERIERELFASQLISERNINTEIEYTKLEGNIQNDKFLQRLISSKHQISVDDFQQSMERRHFNKYWERYQCEFYLFDRTGKSLLSTHNNKPNDLMQLKQLIQQHSEQSPMNPSIFFIRDYTNQYTYIIQQELKGKDNKTAIFYATLKSKKIPEEIGFPRLLISSQIFVIKHLENYSIARYHQNKLISTYGKFNFPTSFHAFLPKDTTDVLFFDDENFNHLVYRKDINNDAIVLSRSSPQFINLATSFSYLFCLFSIVSLPIYIYFHARTVGKTTGVLSTKIQIVLVGTVLLSLIISGVGSGFFVKKQYQEYTNTVIKNKMYSVEQQLKNRVETSTGIANQDSFSINTDLIKIAKYFHADINIYDTHGYLKETSRQKVFNVGLLSEQINPIAKRELIDRKQKTFMHKEYIGSLNYNSTYSSLHNERGATVAYINLQHFGQQQEEEFQVHQFIVSIINIFVLLIAVSAILAIVLSNWITSPLRMLQQRFSTIQLQNNQPIFYKRNDEIGELITSYNQKIEELRIATQQMAQSEREGAWREVAKQIAHEIKNPLTPMKLSIQHLLRTIDSRNGASTENIKKVGRSLMEQIEVITKIVSEFATFAKMPQPTFQTFDLIAIIKNVGELFQHANNVIIQMQLPQECLITGDKNQLSQLLTNLLKNSIQASASNITISAVIIGDRISMRVEDNGNGIHPEEQHKVFTPHFTTKNAGSGIGLSIVKQIVLNHKGTIHFQSTKNIGTQFTVDLPLENVQFH